MRKYSCLLPLLLSLNAIAQVSVSPNAIQTEEPKPEPNLEKPISITPNTPNDLQAQVQATEAELATVTLEDLKQNPSLVSKALNLALLRKNWATVEQVLPIYRESENVDPILVDYAQASLYSEKGEYKKAIAIYRKLIANNPDKLRIRMDLAMLLFADRQDTAAKDQFIKLRSDPNNDEAVNNLIDRYINAIDQRASWSFDAGLSYIRDANVNNASKSEIIRVGNLKFKKDENTLPQKAHGLDFSLGVGKDFNFTGSHYLSFDANSYGKIYWDNHDFDDINARIGFGYKYKDARNTVSVTPFAKYRRFSSDPYSKTFGFSISASRWLSPSWQISTYNELSFEKSLVKGKENDPSEKQLFTSANVLWAPKATQYFTLGGSVFDIHAKSKASSSTRYGLNTSWNQDWGLGVSSKVNLGVGRKVYKGTHYLGVTRKDNDFNAGLTLWNRDWHVWGITPKLSFRYNKVDSNIDDLYSYDKGTVFLQFDKTF